MVRLISLDQWGNGLDLVYRVRERMREREREQEKRAGERVERGNGIHMKCVCIHKAFEYYRHVHKYHALHGRERN